MSNSVKPRIAWTSSGNRSPPSDFAWEHEALAFLKAQLPDHQPYRAWANFEFIAPGGATNEVDVLVLTLKRLPFLDSL
ncbi:MAG: hypothetical protein VBE63_00510 [Lamprobacter sp.]|uniref:hypothetical protein n=1 Tax=Lamprobacter sp. TaxID=3100796 RepID=UPI002B25EB5A|nr:hypothetical protein [Lamprobacter sp.]MEA3638406.1 hypothetical protein [Lamprobacter sp.]